MNWLSPPLRRFDASVRELMDRPGNDPLLLRADLTVLETINRLLGGHAIPLRYLRRWCPSSLALPRVPDSAAGPALKRTQSSASGLSILDLATGGGDIPRAVADWARQENIAIHITAVDANPEILAIAQERSVDYPEIRYEQQDLLALPYGAGSFDVVLNSLTLHHFREDQAVQILRDIRRIACLGYVINDLRRRRLAIWLSRLMARTILDNPIARFDAPVSCERAFSMSEWQVLRQQAGLAEATVSAWWGYRVVLAGWKSSSG